jgi:hypothetical protein
LPHYYIGIRDQHINLKEYIMSESTINIRSFFGDEVTGYGLIKGTNKALAALGIEKVLPGPMGYTYLKKGYVVKGVKDIKSCTGDQAAEWASAYVAKLAAKATVTVEETEMTEAMDLEV